MAVTSIGVLADIHGNVLALEAVASDLARRRVETVVVLGDHLSGPLWARETAEWLMRSSWTLIAGNHDCAMASQPRALCLSDRQALETLAPPQIAWLRSLRPTATVGRRVLACHGTPTDDAAYLAETVERGRIRPARPDEIDERLRGTNARLVLCGHSHLPRVVACRGCVLIVNPGSVGLPAYHDDEPEPHVVETGSPRARYAVVERYCGDWVVTHVAVPYDQQRAARRARQRGRRDWEAALLTGFLDSGLVHAANLPARPRRPLGSSADRHHAGGGRK